MNLIIIGSSFIWVVAMSLILYTNELLPPEKLTAVTGILINVIAIMFSISINSKKKALEFKILSDNITVFLLVSIVPQDLFYGYQIQLLLSILICHFYVKDKNRVYDILMVLASCEMFVYIPLNGSFLCSSVYFNTISMLLIISVLFVLRNKLLMDPNKKYKTMIIETGNIIKNEIIDCITPMTYHIKNLDENSKLKMEQLIDKLKYISQTHCSNISYLMLVVKNAILNHSTNKDIKISFEDYTTKDVNMDFYTLFLLLYVIFDTSISNSSSNISVKFRDKRIVIVDDGAGYDTKSKTFSQSKLKSTVNLLKLFDVSVVFASTVGSGTSISIAME
jgi:hypothetical protein